MEPRCKWQAWSEYSRGSISLSNQLCRTVGCAKINFHEHLRPYTRPTGLRPRLPSYDELQGCIRCGRCLPVCPTYGETQLEMYSPRGRLSLLRAVEDGKLELTRGVEAHLYHCLDCRECNTVCPPGVRIGELIVRGRVAVEEQHPRPRLDQVHAAARAYRR